MGGNAAFCRNEKTREANKSYKEGEFSFVRNELQFPFTRVPKQLMIESGADLVKSLTKDDRAVLLYHKDGDGISGGFIATKTLQLNDVQIRRHIMGDPLLLKNESIMKDILSQKPTVIIAVDLPLDQNPNELIYLKEKTNAKVLVIDHHLIKNDLNRRGMVHVSSHLFSDLPKGFDPSQYCGTQLAYDIALQATLEYDTSRRVTYIGIEKYKWALAGIICDCGKNVINSDFADIYKDLAEVYKVYSRATIEKLEDILTIYGHGGSDPSLPLLAMLFAKGPEEIISGENIWANLIMQEYPSLVEARDGIFADIQESRKQGAPVGSVSDIRIDEEIKSAIIEISHQKFLASDIATLLSRDDFEDYVVTVIQVHDGTTKAKLRCQKGDVDVKSVAQNLGQKLSGFGGGHKRASGADYPTKYLEESKAELTRLIKEEKGIGVADSKIEYETANC